VAHKQGLDTLIVGAPVDDALLDGLLVEILAECFSGECRDFLVGGEAEADELVGGEFANPGAVFEREELGEAQTLFEADDAVLCAEGGTATEAGHHKEYDGHDDPPDMQVWVFRPVMDGDVDGEDKVQEEHGQDEEMEGRVPTGVVFVALRGGHNSPFGVAEWPNLVALRSVRGVCRRGEDFGWCGGKFLAGS
jgi:hypothetical protein